jgi:hypothetical protein
MSAAKPTLAILLAIALLFAGAIGFITWVTEEPEPLQRDPSKVAAPPPREEAQAEPPPAPREPVAPQAEAPPPAPEPGAPSAPPPPPRPPPEPTGVDLMTSLNAERGRILECAGIYLPDDEGERRAALAAKKKGAPRARATLRLELEPQQGQMVVKDVTLLSQEGQNEALGRCAVEGLRGKTLLSFKSRPGPDVKMQFVVEEPGR